MKHHPTVILIASFISIATVACKTKPTEANSTGDEVPSASVYKPTGSDEKPAATAAEPVVFRGPGEQLVKSAGSWTLTGAPRYFGPETLYDLINGGAEVYTAYGLKEMVTADYTSKDKAGVTITAEIYDMGTPLHAFGRFSKFLQGKTDPAAAGKGLPDEIAPRGIFGGANVSLWKGPYLMNLTLLDESENVTLDSMNALGVEVLPILAKALDEKISGETALPAETTLFPEKNLVAGSYLYEPILLGIPALGAGFSASYRQGNVDWTLFATAPFSDEKAATEALKNATDTCKEKNCTAAIEGLKIVGFVPTSNAPTGDKPAKSLAEMIAKFKSRTNV